MAKVHKPQSGDDFFLPKEAVSRIVRETDERAVDEADKVAAERAGVAVPFNYLATQLQQAFHRYVERSARSNSDFV